MAGTVQGNAAAINGLPLGTTQPNLSTRTDFQTVAGLNNSPFVVTGTPALGATVNNGVVLDGPGKYAASLNISSTATSDVGVLVNGFSGSSAIAGGNVIGAFNSDIILPNGVIDPTNLSAPGDLFFSANGTGASTATTYTGVDPTATSAAAVVDIAGSGIFQSGLVVENPSGNLFFTSALNGTASANGTTVGKVTSPGTGPVGNPAVTAGAATDPLDGTGVNSILNLNSRGINALDQYFNDPISPFFAEFTGLVPGPTSAPGVIPPSPEPFRVTNSTSVNAQASANGSSTASNTTGDTNAFSGIFSAGGLFGRDVVQIYQGDATFTSAVGLGTPVETSSSTTTGSASAISNLLSVGAGTAAIRANSGSALPAGPAEFGQSFQSGTITGPAFNAANTTAQSTTGDVVAYTGGLLGSGGNTFASDFNPGNTLTIGFFNIDFNKTPGDAAGNIQGSAESDTNTTASTSSGNAKAANTGITGGLFGADLSSGSPVNNVITRINGGVVNGIASAMSDVKASTSLGTALATNFQTVAGIANYNTTLSAGGVGGTASLVSSSEAISN